MFASKTTNGFYDAAYHGDNMPIDVVEITAEYHAELLVGQSEGMVISWGDDGQPFLIAPPAIPLQIPQKVTMRQARLALHNADLLQSVEAAINAMPEPPQTAVRIEWDYASEVHRSSEFVGMIGALLELDEQALDNLFLKAVEL